MSSTGQIVGGIVGAVVGFFTPVGPVMGAQIGMTLGGLIDPPKVQGPRLDDLNQQTSTYGAFIPRIYGTAPVVGNIFWIQGNKLIERKVDDSGKGGPEVTNFEYFSSFAVGLCEGPIDGVRRIWIGGQLWYDAGAGDVTSIVASNESAGTFTLYTGSDTQLADPLIQADHGVANVPAYRGLAYIVFNELPVKPYGNSLAGAQVRVEVVASGVISTTVQSISTTATGANSWVMAVSGGYAYVANASAGTLQIFNISDPSAPVLLSTTATGGDPTGLAVSGSYAYIANASSNTLKIFNISDPSAPVSLSTTTTGANPQGVVVSGDYAYLVNYGPGTLQIFNISDSSAPALLSTTATGINPYAVAVSGGYAYVTNFGSDTLQVFNISDPSVPVSLSTTATGAGPTGVAVSGDYAYVTNKGSGTLQIFNISNPSAPALLSTTTTATGSEPTGVALSGDYAYVVNFNSNTLQIFNISDPSAPVSLSTAATGNGPLYIALSGSYAYVVNNGSNTFQIFLFSGPLITASTVPLSTIAQSECLKSDLLTAADLDVTGLTDQVRGYRVSSLAPLRGGIDPLRKAWPFDVVQHGYKIKFKRRGGASVATITEGELDARAAGADPGVQITNVREMDLVLPNQLTAKYLDAVREYDVNVAEESR